MTYRNRALLNLAHSMTRCPGCGHSYMDGLEPAHSNSQRHGKGTGHKAADHFHAALCHTCHTELDNGQESREVNEAKWQRAFEMTLTAYWENGWLKVIPPRG